MKQRSWIVRGPRVCIALALATSMSLTGFVYAETNDLRDSTSPQKLFDRARSLMAAGDYAHACPLLEESRQLDDASGTAMNLGVCYELEGNLVAAWWTYGDARALARQEEKLKRAELATIRRRDIEVRSATVEVRLSEPLPPGTILLLDALMLADSDLNARIPVEVGPHVLSVRVPGGQNWKASVEARAVSEHLTIDVPAMNTSVQATDVTATGAAALPKPVPHFALSPQSLTVQASTPRDIDKRRMRYAIGAGGLASLGVGGYFALMAKSSWDKRNQHCAPECDDHAVAYGHDAQWNARIADVAMGCGVLALAADLIWIALDASHERPALAAGGATVTFGANQILIGTRL